MQVNDVVIWGDGDVLHDLKRLRDENAVLRKLVKEYRERTREVLRDRRQKPDASNVVWTPSGPFMRERDDR